MSTENRVVIITGAASGIGRATALAFAVGTNKLVLIDKNAEDLKSIGDECRIKMNEVLKIAANIAEEGETKKIIDSAMKKFGKIDVLVNCAGILYFGGIYNADIMETYDRIMGVNLRAVLSLTHLAVPHLEKTKGCIVNISSEITEKVLSNCLLYGMSKAALTHFTKALALELAPKGIRVNAVHPGATRTNITNHLITNKEMKEKVFRGQVERIPLKRIIEPQEVADLIFYLASDKAKSITGAKFFIDGGNTIS